MSLFARLLLNPEKIFQRTLESISLIGPNLSKDALDGVGLMGSALLEDLHRTKVIDGKLHRRLQEELRRWHRGRTGKSG